MRKPRPVKGLDNEGRTCLEISEDNYTRYNYVHDFSTSLGSFGSSYQNSIELSLPTRKSLNVEENGFYLQNGTGRDHYGTLRSTKSNSASSPLVNSDSIIDDQTKYQTALYNKAVNRASVYKRERYEKRWKGRNIARMFAGIPFAILYGAALYLVLRFIFLDSPESTVPNNNNSTNATTTEKVEVRLDDPTNATEAHVFHVPAVEMGWGKNRPEIMYGSMGFSAVIGTISVFSRGTRCSMLLMLPCLITGRSRAVLFTFIAGLLVNGPLTGIIHNFNEVSKNTACVYKAVAKMAKSSLLRLNDVFRFIEQLRSRTSDPFHFDSNPKPKAKPKPQPVVSSSNLTFPRINALKEQIAWMKKGINTMEKVMSIARKVLTALSIIFMIYDAISYLRSYYADITFDNKYINRNVRHVWESKKHPTILPLRNWEKNEGYKSSSHFIVKKHELKALIRRIFPTVFFTLGALVLILADYLLYKVVVSMKDEEDIAISIGGMEDGLAKAVKSIISYFHETTRLCGVHPIKTSTNSYILISVFLLVAILSCFFDVLISRLRSRMCNIFYTDRAHERADYLYFRIEAGRVNRRTHLMLTIKSNIQKEKRLIEFSPWARLKRFLWRMCCCNRNSSKLKCPGCGWNVKRSDCKDVKFDCGNTQITDRLCSDCHKDFHPVRVHPISQYVSESPSTNTVSEHNFTEVTDDDVYRSL